MPADADDGNEPRARHTVIHTIEIRTSGQGLFEFTAEVAAHVRAAGLREGLCTLFVQHTSASLLIQENADPDVRADLEAFLRRLVPEGDPLWTHVAEGPDDMPSHVRAALTQTHLAVPIAGGELALGTWQGIYLWEHRRRGSRRRVVVHVS
jgi:secondary thiamine-phosphate synthase enzyme